MNRQVIVPSQAGCEMVEEGAGPATECRWSGRTSELVRVLVGAWAPRISQLASTVDSYRLAQVEDPPSRQLPPENAKHQGSMISRAY